jgi:hypothetical protein
VDACGTGAAGLSFMRSAPRIARTVTRAPS